MAKSSNQKLKLLYIMRFLLNKSDEEHPVSIADIIAELSRYGISAERKSLYDDIEALTVYGLDIVQKKGRNGGYYIASREFELPELKLLVDSVQSSKFITQKKTISLIKKIESLASHHDAGELQRQVYVHNRVKSMNESVYYNVDIIANAINDDKPIRFKYFELNVDKERVLRHGGATYEVSPFALMWDDENYYLVAWDKVAGLIKHFRVDKMLGISAVEAQREGKEEFEKLDLSAYTSKCFGMFGGEEESVTIRFSNRLVGAVLDRFGRDIILIKDGDDHFRINLNIVISPQFYGWLFSFGTEAEVISPQSVRSEMCRQAKEIQNLYK